MIQSLLVVLSHGFGSAKGGYPQMDGYRAPFLNSILPLDSPYTLIRLLHFPKGGS